MNTLYSHFSSHNYTRYCNAEQSHNKYRVILFNKNLNNIWGIINTKLEALKTCKMYMLRNLEGVEQKCVCAVLQEGR